MPVMNVDGYDYTWKTVGESQGSRTHPFGGIQRCRVRGILDLGDEVLL